MPSPILLPVILLVLWTLIILVWSGVARFSDPALKKLGPDGGKRTADLGAIMSPASQYKVDNYNHLTEQPTLFYATALSIAVPGHGGDTVALVLAWIYVGSRVVHSLVHATANVVLARMAIFMVGTLALLGLAVVAVRIFL